MANFHSKIKVCDFHESELGEPVARTHTLNIHHIQNHMCKHKSIIVVSPISRKLFEHFLYSCV